MSHTDSLAQALRAARSQSRGTTPGGPGRGTLGGSVVGTGIPADDSGWVRVVDAGWPWPVLLRILATGPAPAATHRWEIRVRLQTGLAGPSFADVVMGTRVEYEVPGQHLTVEVRSDVGTVVAVACAPVGQP